MNTDTRVRDTRGRRKKDSGSLLKGLVRRLRKAWFSYAAGTALDTSRTNQNMRCWQLEPSQSSNAGMPAKLNLSQLLRPAGGN